MTRIRPFNDPDRPSPRSPGPSWPVVLAIFILVAAAIALIWWLPEMLESDNDRLTFVSRFIVLAIVVAGAAVHWRGRLHVAALQALAWAGICVVIVLAYSFRHEFSGLRDRVVGELAPHRAIARGEEAVTIRAGGDGHFNVEVEVDGTPIRFMIDTGATGIALSRRHAERIGINPRQLRFTLPIYTANGRAMAAPIQIREMRLGPIVVYDIDAIVLNNLDGPSLLGMSFLNRLSSYNVDNGVLTLRR